MGVKDALGDNKKFLLLALALLVISVIMMYGLNSGMYSPMSPIGNNRSTYTSARQVLQSGVDYSVTIRTKFGDISIDLFEQTSPINVNSLLFLASERYYENLSFHKVIPNFVIQAGDAKGDGTGDPGYVVDKEATRPFEDYSVGMANGSQFFIVLPGSDKSSFNGQYTLIGKVTSGFAVVDSIAKVETDDNYKPINDVTINSVQIME
jgi:cyclophilin family peptidyl-prolyl cis-trans isomerase